MPDEPNMSKSVPEHKIPRTIEGLFYSRKPDGTKTGIRFHGVIDEQWGTGNEIAAVILEGEMHGNDGKTRVHLFLH